MRHSSVRAVAVSNYTAGVLSRFSRATVLPPGLSEDWYQELVKARRRSHSENHEVIVTSFRLAAWQEKGLPEIIEAIASLKRASLELVVCGNGEAPAALRKLINTHHFCRLRTGLSDSELAAQFAAAKVFVLATKMRGGSSPCGEGFGMVLQEAQLAGTPVVAPAYGGSHEAFVEGLTGVAPADERPGALAKVLRDLLEDTQRLDKMSSYAGEYACERFCPARYSKLLLDRLL